MVRELFEVEPDRWQEKALIKFPSSPRMCMKACTGPGKTAVLAWLGWNFALTRPHSIVGVTSISADNLKANLWTELARWYARSPILQSLFEMTKTLIYAKQYPKTWQMQARSWAKDADPAQIGNALRGLHSEYVMWLLDESGDYPDAIMPVCEAIFSGDPKEAHIVQAGNPIKLGGPLYQATLNPDVWELIEITADPDDPNRTPRVSVEHAREQIRLYGRENPWVRVNIFGQFPQSSFNTLLGPEDIKAAQARNYREVDIAKFARILGFDAALLGDDVNVIFPRQGLVAFNQTRLRNVEPHLVAGQIATKWKDWDADACFADNTGGYGAAAISHLKLEGYAPIPVGFAERANDPRFFNKRAEIYWLGAQWVKDGGQLPPAHVHGMDEFTKAMTQTTYTAKGDKLIIEPKLLIKTRLGFSPDDADSFCLTFSHPVAARNHRATGTPRHLSEWDFAAAMEQMGQQGGAARNHRSEWDPYQ